MNTVTAYQVVTGESPQELAYEVESAVNDGSEIPWRLQGGVAVGTWETAGAVRGDLRRTTIYAQALTREVPATPHKEEPMNTRDTPNDYRHDLSLYLEVDFQGTAVGRRFAFRRSEVVAPEPPYHEGELCVTLSQEQAREIVVALWERLQPEERPCPR